MKRFGPYPSQSHKQGDGMDASLLPEGERTEKGEMN
jgi:hypothetical protein